MVSRDIRDDERIGRCVFKRTQARRLRKTGTPFPLSLAKSLLTPKFKDSKISVDRLDFPSCCEFLTLYHGITMGKDCVRKV